MLTQWQDEYAAKVESERGKRAASQARYMLRRMGLSETTGRHMDEARTRLKGEVSANAANRIMAETRSFLGWLRKTGRVYIARDDIHDCLEPFKVERVMVDLPNQAAIRAACLETMNSGRYTRDNVRLLTLCLFAGLRPGEAEGVDHGNVQPRYIHLRRTKTGVERHAYYDHSRVLSAWLHRRVQNEPVMATKARNSLLAALGRAGWTQDTRNTLRKLCVSYCACSGRFSEYQMVQQFGHTQVVSMAHYRDRQVLEAIKPGECIEEWMGIADLIPQLIAAATDKRPRRNNAGSHDATSPSQPGPQGQSHPATEAGSGNQG